jgi:TetR/AcrR family transcriptional repressor of nem operon
VTKPSLHYHFAGKADLGTALIARYTNRFVAALHALDAAGRDAPAMLDGYVALYLEALRQDRMCLCGILAAEYQTLPPRMQQAVLEFFTANETWLQRVLDAGRDAETLRYSGTSRDTARMIISCLEGAMLVARPYRDLGRFHTAAANLLANLTAPDVKTRGKRR